MSWFSRKQPPVIADAKASDAVGLAAIHATGFERGWDAHEFERMLTDRLILAHLARPGGKGDPNGFAMSRVVVDEAEILTIAVATSARRAGLATLLLRHHLGRLAAAGARKVFLEVAEDNMAAIRLYKRNGFDEIARRKAYYARAKGPPATAIVMERIL